MSRFEPRLPDESGYWDALAEQICADAALALARRRDEQQAWWAALARGCPALAAAAVVAVVAGWITFAETTESLGESPYSEVARAIVPTDLVAQAFVRGQSPPTVESLMPFFVRAEEDR